MLPSQGFELAPCKHHDGPVRRQLLCMGSIHLGLEIAVTVSVPLREPVVVHFCCGCKCNVKGWPSIYKCCTRYLLYQSGFVEDSCRNCRHLDSEQWSLTYRDRQLQYVLRAPLLQIYRKISLIELWDIVLLENLHWGGTKLACFSYLQGTVCSCLYVHQLNKSLQDLVMSRIVLPQYELVECFISKFVWKLAFFFRWVDEFKSLSSAQAACFNKSNMITRTASEHQHAHALLPSAMPCTHKLLAPKPP
ncbi:hypothetical protein GOP47_0004189 [Adiantum capillus-veneris]|uniref:Uncharacterized protein n=1 Tax=Adiantum capillus-veneris TaxID=13818 RepID=A0A9D4V876_ADICA|nr:hypothetical protein GOP47_0004189 [Adiantum capillus-veneris]